ncbi:MFS transporter [Nocardia spumae]|uniref:MFS transporter n=1 Tax=Nocardia spumae TaxID=2887190 RepID=UPI001D14663A|nr:MFS transporter [Nocardia spumae]
MTVTDARSTDPEPPGPAARPTARAAEQTTNPRYRMWLAAWPVVAVFILSNAATPLYVLWQHDIGFSKGTMTVVFACYIAGLLGSLLVSGLASDRWGRRRVMVPALILALVACGLFASANTVPALMIARLCTGIAVGAAVSAGMAAVTDVAGSRDTSRAALIASCAMVFGAGLGPLLSGVMSQTLPAPTTLVFAVEAALLITALLVVVRLPLPRPPASSSGAWIRIPAVPRGAGRYLLPGIAAFAPGITATSFVLSLGPALLSGLLHTGTRIVAGAMAFAMFLTATGVQFAVRALGRRTILLSSIGATGVSMISLITAVHTGEIPALAAAALLAGAGQGLGQLGGLSLLNANIPGRRLAEANAALNVGGYLPAGLLPVSAGYLSDAIGLSMGTTIFGIVLITMAVFATPAILSAMRESSPSEETGAVTRP